MPGRHSIWKKDLISAEEAGVDDMIANSPFEGEVEDACEVMDRMNVEYVSTRGEYSRKPRTDGDKVGTDAIHDKDRSEVSCTLVKRTGDVWLASGTGTIEWNDQSAKDSTTVDDVMSLSWRDSAWEPEEISRDNTWISVGHDGGDIGYPSGNFEKYDFDGVSASIGYLHGIDYGATLQTDLVRQGSGQDETVLFEFKNTFAFLPAEIESISIGLPFGLDVTFSNEVDEWTLPASDYPE